MRNAWLVLGLLSSLSLFSGCDDTPNKAARHASGGVHSATLSQNGRYALIASVNHEMGLWDTHSNALLFSWKHSSQNPSHIVDVALSANGQYAVTAEKHSLVLWKVASGNALYYWRIPHAITDLAVSDNGRFAIVGTQAGYADQIDLSNGRTIYRLPHQGKVNAVAISEEGHYALTGGNDNTARLWDLKTGQLRHLWRHDKAVNFVMLSPKMTYALSAADQAYSKLWRVSTGELVKTLNKSPMTTMSGRFSPSEKYLALGVMPQNLYIWDIDSRKRVKSLRMPRESFWKPSATIIYAVAFSPDERSVRTEDSVGYGREWDVR